MKLPSRNAIGFDETLSIIKCLIHYRRRVLILVTKIITRINIQLNFLNLWGGYSDAVSSGCASIYIALKSLKLPPNSVITTTCN